MKLRVKELAEAKGWDIFRLCSEAHLSLTTIQKVWKDRTVDIPNTETDTLDKIATALEVPVKDLHA